MVIGEDAGSTLDFEEILEAMERPLPTQALLTRCLLNLLARKVGLRENGCSERLPNDAEERVDHDIR